MKISFTYKTTMIACFVAYIVQAIVNNFAPLLFLTFQNQYDISLAKITMLVTINFTVQLIVDLLSAFFVDKIGYRISLILAHVFSTIGFISLAILPDIISPYAGIVISVIIYAIGGGLLEVIVSPVVEACPTEDKGAAMSLLHSFYCWGHVGVVLISTAFFFCFGIVHWKILIILWALICVINIFIFIKTPIAPLIEDNQEGLSFKQLFSQKTFWILFIMMICAGASEQAVSQWASVLAEKGLGVTKTLGDLAGPMMFAFFMGSSRAFYGKYGEKINLDSFMRKSCILCIISYLMIALIPNPVLNLIGCAICGLSVGIMWPGSFSKASSSLPLGGTVMFALLALGGDLGCSSGPTFAGLMASLFSDNIQIGILTAVIFPIGLYILLQVLKPRQANQ